VRRSDVAVVGCGYVGLTTATCLAHLGHLVRATDVDRTRVELLSSGRSPLLEPGLADLLAEGLAAGRLSFGTDNRQAAGSADFVFLCVQTPPRPDGHLDTRALEAVAREIGPVLRPGAVVLSKSTCPLGSNARVRELLGRGDVSVVTNPEFLREGSAVKDFLEPDRVVIGADDIAAAELVAALFAGVGGARIITDPTSAELVKYAANAFLATKVTFANSLAALCEAFGADVGDVAAAVGADRRIGAGFLAPGPGFGGSCLPKDTVALAAAARERAEPFELLETVTRLNERQRLLVAGRVAELAGGSLDGRLVALWGLTFKAGTDDLRDSPALDVARCLEVAGARVRAFDPAVGDVGRLAPLGLDAEVCADRYEACRGAAVLVVATEWPQFARSDWEAVGRAMAARRVVDARNVLDPAELARHGFEYAGIGISRRAPSATTGSALPGDERGRA